MLKKKDTKLSVDVQKKLPIVRVIDVDAEDGSVEDAPIGLKPVKVVKKELNIPICDVVIDPAYETYVLPTFQLPSSYVRHIKKIGDEVDITVDYCMEDADLVWVQTNPRIHGDKDVQRVLNVQSFERIIDILEKHTGFAPEPVPQSHAEKLVTERLGWPVSVTSKVLPEIYHYWLAKREKLGKPVCRKYWPQSSSSDTNPHHVFRPRDKERYRLRKQQKKNDIEAFRKMQQLRQEFNRARELLQLVVERELLRESETEIQREIFERTLHDLGAHPCFGVTLPEAPFRHRLRFESLLRALPRRMQSSEEQCLGRPLSIDDVKMSLVIPRGSSASSGVPSSMGIDPLKREKKDRKTPGRKRTVNLTSDAVDGEEVGEATREVSGTDGADKAVGVTGAGVQYGVGVFLINPAVPGPSQVCRPQWPNFMDDLSLRSKICVSGISQYCADLELRLPLPGSTSGHGISGISTASRHWGDVDLYTNSVSASDHQLPRKFKFRGRVGRGGRVVMDRIPVYDSVEEQSSEYSFVFPTGLPRSSKWHVASGCELLGATRSHVHDLGSQSSNYTSHPMIRQLPAVLPVSRGLLTSSLGSREFDIYAHSDSEDEKIEFVRGWSSRSDAKVEKDQALTKYSLKV